MDPRIVAPPIDWPDPAKVPNGTPADLAVILYQAQINAVQAVFQAQLADEQAQGRDEASRSDAASAAEETLRAAIQGAYLTVAQGALDRSLTRANFVTAAASAIGTSYAALLALVYSGGSHVLPGRGIIPALFLGVAFALSSFYVAFVRQTNHRRYFLPSGIGGSIQEDRLLTFIEWVNDGVMHRMWALRIAVLSLGLGVTLLPLPFVDISTNMTILITIAASVTLLIWAFVEIYFALPGSSTPPKNP